MKRMTNRRGSANQQLTISSHQFRSFTLIELLVVVAIIAVLVAMLLPAIAQARAEGYMASCGVQLKMVGVGLLMYSEDNHGWFPWNYIGQPGDGRPGNAYAWDLQPYNLTYLFTKAVCNPGAHAWGADSSKRQANTYLSPVDFYCPATKGRSGFRNYENNWQSWGPVGDPYGDVSYISYDYFGSIEWTWYWQGDGFSPMNTRCEKLVESVLFMDEIQIWDAADASANLSVNHETLRAGNILHGDGHVERKAAAACRIKYESHLPGFGW